MGFLNREVPTRAQNTKSGQSQLTTCHLQEGSLDIGVDVVDVGEIDGDEVGENRVAEGPNMMGQDVAANVSPTLAEVMEMEFDSPEAAVPVNKQYGRGKGFSMRHGR
ncbi:hypothetical protein PIB30_015096 [Stylosanthes scabra]|uniref:Uncharacterized protein n=1 Tax=Stylosanthes scabra TaxID=79078 RepID=A0ABU6R773_9FABA|nr:hypothetical protein [Stylosanthes scabra]